MTCGASSTIIFVTTIGFSFAVRCHLFLQNMTFFIHFIISIQDWNFQGHLHNTGVITITKIAIMMHSSILYGCNECNCTEPAIILIAYSCKNNLFAIFRSKSSLLGNESNFVLIHCNITSSCIWDNFQNIRDITWP